MRNYISQFFTKNLKYIGIFIILSLCFILKANAVYDKRFSKGLQTAGPAWEYLQKAASINLGDGNGGVIDVKVYMMMEVLGSQLQEFKDVATLVFDPNTGEGNNIPQGSIYSEVSNLSDTYWGVIKDKSGKSISAYKKIGEINENFVNMLGAYNSGDFIKAMEGYMAADITQKPAWAVEVVIAAQNILDALQTLEDSVNMMIIESDYK